MSLEVLRQALVSRFGEAHVLADAPLAPLTTFRIGGPADLLFEPRSAEELIDAVHLARTLEIPVTMLGGGSNVLVADAGVRGLVLRPRGGAISPEGEGRVRADAAVTINGLVRWLVARGLAGLEAWAGTPGTVGGGVYGNAHWAGRLLSEQIEDVRVLTPEGQLIDVPAADMEFGYDRSRLQRTGEILVSAVFRVSPGRPEDLRAIARRSLAYRKSTQPLHMPSAGCVFQNPGLDDPVPAGVPRSAGALIDRAGLKGARQGGAAVSTTHANFLVNLGDASAQDVRALLERCRDAVREATGVVLRDEIVYLGEFEDRTGGTGVDAAD